MAEEGKAEGDTVDDSTDEGGLMRCDGCHETVTITTQLPCDHLLCSICVTEMTNNRNKVLTCPNECRCKVDIAHTQLSTITLQQITQLIADRGLTAVKMDEVRKMARTLPATKHTADEVSGARHDDGQVDDNRTANQGKVDNKDENTKAQKGCCSWICVPLLAFCCRDCLDEASARVAPGTPDMDRQASNQATSKTLG